MPSQQISHTELHCAELELLSTDSFRPHSNSPLTNKIAENTEQQQMQANKALQFYKLQLICMKNVMKFIAHKVIALYIYSIAPANPQRLQNNQLHIQYDTRNFLPKQ